MGSNALNIEKGKENRINLIKSPLLSTFFFFYICNLQQKLVIFHLYPDREQLESHVFPFLGYYLKIKSMLLIDQVVSYEETVVLDLF